MAKPADDRVSEETYSSLPTRIWPTRYNTKRYYVAIVLLYVVVAVFAFASPIKEHLGVDETLFTMPLDLIVASVGAVDVVTGARSIELADSATLYAVEFDAARVGSEGREDRPFVQTAADDEGERVHRRGGGDRRQIEGHPQDGAGHGDEHARQESPLEEPVAQERAHGFLNARGRRGGRRG